MHHQSLFACLFAQPAHFQSGIYAGAMLGANIANAHWNGTNGLFATNDNQTPESLSPNWKPNGPTQQTNFAGRIFGGYQIVSDKIFIAAELGGNFSKQPEFRDHTTKQFSNVVNYPLFFPPPFQQTQTLSATATTNTTVSLSNSNLFIDIRPGFLVKPNILLYGRAGLSFFNNLTIMDSAQWTEQGTDTGAPTPIFTPLQASGASRNSGNNTGIRLGLGAEYLMTQQLSVLFDYTYTTFGNVTTRTQAGQLGTSGTSTVWQKIYESDSPVVSVTTQSVLVGLSYHFA
jgi:opacity protein-like surface antigen